MAEYSVSAETEYFEGAEYSFSADSKNLGFGRSLRNAHKDSMSAEDLTALYFQQLDEKDVMDLYREGNLVADIGWVDINFDCFSTLPCCYANTEPLG